MTVVDHMERESGVRAAAKVIFKILKMFMHVVIKSFNMSELYLSLVDFKSEGYWWCMNSASIAFMWLMNLNQARQRDRSR